MKHCLIGFILCVVLSCNQSPSNFESLANVAYFTESASEKAPTAPEVERKLIRTGSISLTVQDATHVRSEIEEVCRRYDGYVASERRSGSGDVVEYQQVIRVPAVNFDNVVRSIEGLGTEVLNKSTETSDVTSEIIDFEARLKTKRELENRYREIVRQATKVSDILSIESELNDVRADIESMEGRLRYLNSQVAYSTLNVSFGTSAGRRDTLVSMVSQAFADGWGLMLSVLVALVGLWPFITLGVVSIIAYRRLRLNRPPEREAR